MVNSQVESLSALKFYTGTSLEGVLSTFFLFISTSSRLQTSKLASTSRFVQFLFGIGIRLAVLKAIVFLRNIEFEGIFSSLNYD